MKVLVTGGTGEVGHAVVERLVRHGHEVRVIGRRAGVSLEGARYAQCDVTDFCGLREQVKGMEAIVHLAAVRHPALGPGQEIFRVNCAGTYNVYRAAADEGIRRVVSASSINAFGYYFGIERFELHYFPVDEGHPGVTTDPYSFSKQIVEEIGTYFWRREGVSGVCLRLPAVYDLAEGRTVSTRETLSRCKQECEALLSQPERERQARVRELTSTEEALRAQRVWEVPLEARKREIPDRSLLFGRNNFWTSVDARDAAQAVEKGLLTEYGGCHPLYVHDGHNSVGAPTRALASVFFPKVTTWKRPLPGTESLVSIEKVRTLIGFEPEHLASEWLA